MTGGSFWKLSLADMFCKHKPTVYVLAMEDPTRSSARAAFSLVLYRSQMAAFVVLTCLRRSRGEGRPLQPSPTAL